MKLGELAEALKNRTPWHVMKELIRYHNLDSGAGWLKTIEKWTVSKEMSEKETAKLLSVLGEGYIVRSAARW